MRAMARGQQLAGLSSVLCAAWRGKSHCTSAEDVPARFRFGVIADIQFCDIADATNFSGSETRFYSHGLQTTRQAVAQWNQQPTPAEFVLQLGDLIDGQNSGTYGQGLAFQHEPRSQAALDAVLSELDHCHAPMYHAIGNHELYNFSWEGLSARLNVGDKHVVSRDGEFYWSWSPHPGWTFIMLNSYKVSVMQDVPVSYTHLTLPTKRIV
eukprot:TRINITY_DN25930_c0_g1_i2.p1 TRINITY_DN25930_c0_g1~~TRINITY_DN25930_c0_g1_i2.p1  ORF type:complete len:210 (+),score=35.61 TRINITY_DN25930_c0_g1_i2:181-810(+)